MTESSNVATFQPEPGTSNAGWEGRFGGGLSYLDHSAFIPRRASHTPLHLPSLNVVHPGHRREGQPSAQSASPARQLSPDVSVLTGNGYVLSGRVQVHVVEGGLLHHVVAPGEHQPFSGLKQTDSLVLCLHQVE